MLDDLKPNTQFEFAVKVIKVKTFLKIILKNLILECLFIYLFILNLKTES